MCVKVNEFQKHCFYQRLSVLLKNERSMVCVQRGVCRRTCVVARRIDFLGHCERVL